jgi:CAAX protease family protein
MKFGNATGLQIAFFTFAGLLLAVPLSNYVESILLWSNYEKALVGKAIPFVLFGLVLALFPALRRLCIEELSLPIPANRKREVVLVAVTKPWFAFAVAGGVGLWFWLIGGSDALERRMLDQRGEGLELTWAFSTPGLIQHLFLVVFVAPVIEEIVFRGFLYRAWEREWGWVASTLLTSVVFGLYHPHFFAAFFASIIYVCLYRRTGTLWAPIVVHGIFNLSLWYPLMGRLVFPRGVEARHDISAWKPQLACLLVAAIVIPMYVWLSRKPYQPAKVSSP